VNPRTPIVAGLTMIVLGVPLFLFADAPQLTAAGIVMAVVGVGTLAGGLLAWWMR
jgi:hypothetical protein